MQEKTLESGERLDDLLIDRLKIIQHPAEFCFSLDAILLAHFVTVRLGIRAVDLGAGTGVLGLLLHTRGAGWITGVEINTRMAQMAERSIKLNGLSEKINVLNRDFRSLRGVLPGGSWDVVISNPPYRAIGKGYINQKDHVAMARHELTANLDDVISAAQYLLKYRGRFAMVHLPERMAEILKKMSEAGLEAKRLQLVYPSLSKKPNMLLVEGIRGAKSGLDVLPPLIVYKDDGTYSDEIMRYYGGNG